MRAAEVFLSALIASLAASAAARAATPPSLTIEVDATAPGTPLQRVWAYHGYDEPNYTTTDEGRELLRTLSAAHRAPFHVRSHFLFNSGDGTPALKWGSTNIYDEDESGASASPSSRSNRRGGARTKRRLPTARAVFPRGRERHLRRSLRSR